MTKNAVILAYVNAFIKCALDMRVPRTREQRESFFNILRQTGKLMAKLSNGEGEDPEVLKQVEDSIQQANLGNWSPAFDLLGLYYFMKRIPYKRLPEVDVQQKAASRRFASHFHDILRRPGDYLY